MTRIYFKPQSCSVRNPRNRGKQAVARGAPAHQQNTTKEDHGGQAGSNWRNQLEPDAIDQIADGLEKMVLSWTQPFDHGDGTPHPDSFAEFPAEQIPDHRGRNLSSNSSTRDVNPSLNPNGDIFPSSGSRDRALLVASNSRPISAMAPALEEMMRGELIKSCRPSITNGEPTMADQQSTEASFWYLTPAKSLPNCVGSGSGRAIEEGIKVQDAASLYGGSFAPLEISSQYNFDMIEHALQESGPPAMESKGRKGEPRKGSHMRSVEEDDEENDSDSTAIKESAIMPEKKADEQQAWNHYASHILGHLTGGNQITELLGKKPTPMANAATPCPPLILEGAEEESIDAHKKRVEELQIALLECAMEYEVKIVEMKMQMLHMKSEQRQKQEDSTHLKPGSEKSVEISSQDIDQLISTSSQQDQRTDGQRVEYLRKQLCRLQREKLAVSRELNDLKKRERQFDLQRRSLDDALGRVNTLQRELGKREQEIVDCQLREKEVRAQLYEVQLALHKAQSAQIEPRKLLSLLPALREWLQTIKKVPCEPTFIVETHEKSTPRTPPVDSIVCSVTKEIQALQKALSKLASKK